MKYLDLTFSTPEANLACDEALLDACEQGGDEVLRVWESKTVFVVAGYANQLAREVRTEVCRRQGILVLRRCTGGGTVVQGPGCLNFTLVLRIDRAAPLATIRGTNTYIMAKHQQLFQDLLSEAGPSCGGRGGHEHAVPTASASVGSTSGSPNPAVQVRGHTDLVLNQLKFSGNAQRRRRHCLLFHGTFLLRFDLALIEQLLPIPSREPAYRAGRSHTEFLTNLPLSATDVKQALRRSWAAHQTAADPPGGAIEQLVKDKYARDEWNLRF